MRQERHPSKKGILSLSLSTDFKYIEGIFGFIIKSQGSIDIVTFLLLVRSVDNSHFGGIGTTN